MFFDDNLNFGKHLKYLINKVFKSIGLLRKFQMILLSRSLATMYESFIRSQLDQGDIFFDQTFNKAFHNLESIQYNASLVVTGSIRGNFREKLYHELGFETLQERRWFCKPRTFTRYTKINLCVFSTTYYPYNPAPVS